MYDLIKPHVAELVVCNPRRNALLKEGSKSDRIDAKAGPPILSIHSSPFCLIGALTVHVDFKFPITRLYVQVTARAGSRTALRAKCPVIAFGRTAGCRHWT